MRFENTDVFNFEGAFRGMRNPMNSWDKSDSEWGVELRWNEEDKELFAVQDNIGPRDMELAQRLVKGGSPHRKFLRQIIVSVDITAPLYWWKEFDTYKVGTVANSTSTMHKLASTPITMECFETDDYSPGIVDVSGYINLLETMRQAYNKTKDKRVWKELIRWLPESWLQTRTVTFNYEVIRQMVFWRTNHKLTEWHQFVNWARTLPYAEELIFYENEIPQQ